MASFGPNGGPVPSGDNGDYPGSETNMGGSNGEAKCTLWMGELEAWMDDAYVQNVFRSVTDHEVQTKIIRDKATGNAGYCFVEFPTNEAASVALQSLNGRPIPNSARTFKLNWASGGGLNDRRDDRAPEYSIFVGDLSPDISEFILMNLFQARFASTKAVKIMTDNQTGQSRGYGFVRFTNEHDQQRALVEMQGVYCGTRPMRIAEATPKNRIPSGLGASGYSGMHPGGGGQPMWSGPQFSPFGNPGFQPQSFTQMNQFTDPNNTTVFVGGLSGYVTEDELRSFFQGFGDITYVKIPPGKGCGFVQFVHRHAAEMAINQMQGYPIGNSRVRLSWGRSQNNSGIGTQYRPSPAPPFNNAQAGLHGGQGHSGPAYGGMNFGQTGPMHVGQAYAAGPAQGFAYGGHGLQHGPAGYQNPGPYGGTGPSIASQ